MATYWEFQIEVTNSEGSIEDPYVFLAIKNGKVERDRLIPNDFVKKYVDSTFEDDGSTKRGFKSKNNELHEFSILKMVYTKVDGVSDRDYFYLNSDGTLPKELPKYVINAYELCLKEGVN